MRVKNTTIAATAALLLGGLWATENVPRPPTPPEKEPKPTLSRVTDSPQESEEEKPKDLFKGLALRGIGPALMSGRIADIVFHPNDPHTWYVAVGSGGVWKTVNHGTTWTPIFDDQPVYSIGALALDPTHPDVVYVGTGENVGGRHVGIGDGLYRSMDGGKSWKKLGLEKTEHIAKILIHPTQPQTIWVAAQGPLWSGGGQRGVFKTTDGGQTWKNVLSKGPFSGVTDLVQDPRDPKRLYAATWQHHRTVAAYVGGGPESGIYLSTDAGETWNELKKGLPKGNMGKIGLAISPLNPDVLYAAIELDRRKGAVWRSEDRGASWEKRGEAVGGGTGPHYYQEIYASPHALERIYVVSNYTQVSEDGGKTFRQLNIKHKHVDDHAIVFRKDAPNYIMFGCDGGIYETYDLEKTWRFYDNLPVTQFYKVAVDDAEPFYTVYGGTQDNNTQGGPSRTDNRHGIRNSDWFITLFADGHQPAIEPGNPDIMYSSWQGGNLARVDRTTGEVVHIQPQPGKDDPPERRNWDAPILVSAHDPKRLYHGSQRLWRSDDRGDRWRAISGDLTRNEDRMLIPHMGRQWSWDAGWDLLAMSSYNTITSIAESPLDEKVLYVGTDDGLIQVTEDGGQTWRAVEVGALPGVPERAFVNDIKADLFDRDTVYVALDNHKYGDYAPYLLRSSDQGRTWSSLAKEIPERHLVWRVVQDHEDRNLLFAGTELGLFFSADGGKTWRELNGGLPTIPLRDLAIQRRENDLIAASFGRGFFILDDYAALRNLSSEALEKEALLFAPSRPTWWYIEQHPLGFSDNPSQGDAYYSAPNPPFGATFTYYLKEDLRSLEQLRQKDEQPKVKAGEDTPFPGFEAIEEELAEVPPEIWLTVRNEAGDVIRRISGPAKKGFHRVAWDLRYPAVQALTPEKPVPPSERKPEEPKGHLAMPGRYTVTLSKRVRGEMSILAGPESFAVERLRAGALEGKPTGEVVQFWARLANVERGVTAAFAATESFDGRIELMKKALAHARAAPTELDDTWRSIRAEIRAIKTLLGGQPSKNQIGEDGPPTIRSRLDTVAVGVSMSTYGPTPTHEQTLALAEESFREARARLETLRRETLPAFEAQLHAAGAPWTPGAAIPGDVAP